MCKVIDYIRQHEEVFRAIIDDNIVVGDVDLVGMYDEAVRMLDEGAKKTFIAEVLSEKYGVTNRTFFAVMKRLGKEL